ncbi:MAG: DUF4394 domain-containing protein, partial [Gemmataceae bacterium]|nr:DUF4394 domain-containing protein [Gemmataceae bacterium]
MLTRFLSRLRPTSPAAQPATRPRQELRLEGLEGREVPATLFGLAAGNTLVRFDSATPGTTTTVAVTGLGTNQTLVGIDFRPRTGQLYGTAVANGSTTTSVLTTYTINPRTGAATLVGATAAAVTGAGDVATGLDFNPTVDRIRFSNLNDANIRLNPASGALAGTDTNLSPTATEDIVTVAYDRNFDRQNNAGDTNTLGTTLFAINRFSNSLATIGGVNGTPSPNGGVVTDVGPLGFTLDANSTGGFDILASTQNNGLGTAFTALTVGGLTRLYTLNLTSGAGTLVGTVGSGATALRDLAVVPDSVVVVGSGQGAAGDVRILDAATGAVRQAIVPFSNYQGGVRVAVGDVNRDGIPDAIVTAVAPQGHVKVFNGSTGAQLYSFFAFSGFNGNVNVGVGDVNRDGFADILVVANGSNGHVKAFSGLDGSQIASFFAYQGFMGNAS